MPVPASMWRSKHRTEEAWSQSAVATIELICRHLGVDSLASISMLDVGCGTKLTKAFLEHDLPIARYVGLDVYKEMVDHLRDHVRDPRFAYHHVDFHNARYHPTGTPMSEYGALPLDEQFDVIGLFSVFTHLAPVDFSGMLRLLRPAAKPEGRLIFSLYLNETTAKGYGIMDKWAPIYESAIRENPEVLSRANGLDPPDFVDLLPDRPLEAAVYSREFALSLLEKSEWEIESLNPPEWFIQHHFVCRPA
ncbi:MAG: class I SAM-dependent methyltransferase [Acidimicrobiia bacterium]